MVCPESIASAPAVCPLAMSLSRRARATEPIAVAVDGGVVVPGGCVVRLVFVGFVEFAEECGWAVEFVQTARSPMHSAASATVASGASHHRRMSLAVEVAVGAGGAMRVSWPTTAAVVGQDTRIA